MCGIAGFASSKKSNIKQRKTRLNGVLKTLYHRGPDSQGIFAHQSVTMGMRRLSIIDVSGGDQPFWSEDKHQVIIGNGEIYNHKKLLRKLKKPHTFKSKSDIEVVLHLYEEYGEAAFALLEGMYALALYDGTTKQLYLVRDRWGEKPLYYAKTKHEFLFGSELQSLLHLLKKTPTIIPNSINAYLHYYYIPGEQTAFAEIKKVAPGHFLRYSCKSETIESVAYWTTPKKTIKVRNPAVQIRSLFASACEAAMMSDVPVGIALSGGKDSAAILSVLSDKHRKQLTAITVGYEGSTKVDERKIAAKVAEAYKIRHHEILLTDKEVVSLFPEVVMHHDDLIADISAFGFYAVTQKARSLGIKVLLTGAGGDELFWGYPWVNQATMDNQTIFGQNQPAYRGAEHYFKPMLQNSFRNKLSADYFHSISNAGAVPNLKNPVETAQHFTQLLRSMWFEPDVLAISDRIAMANSVETRAPFLDKKLTEFVFGCENTLTAYTKPRKFWLIQALYGKLPPFLLSRTAKQGFTPPVARWLFAIQRQYMPLIRNGCVVQQGIFSSQSMNLLSYFWWIWPWSWYQNYQLLVLELWLRQSIWRQKPSDIATLVGAQL